MFVWQAVFFFSFFFFKRERRTDLFSQVECCLMPAWCPSVQRWLERSPLAWINSRKKPFCHEGEWQCHFQKCQPAVKTRGCQLGWHSSAAAFRMIPEKEGGQGKEQWRAMQPSDCYWRSLRRMASSQSSLSRFTSGSLHFKVVWHFKLKQWLSDRHVQRLIAASSWPAWQSSHHIWIYECGSYMPLQTCYSALRCTTCIQWWYMASRTCVCVCDSRSMCP